MMQESRETTRKAVKSALFTMESRKTLTPEDWNQLRTWTAAPDPKLRQMVTGFLAQRTEQAAGELLLMLSRDPDPAVRAYALDVLCDFPGHACRDRLRQAAASEPDAYGRYCAILSCADVMAALRERDSDVCRFFTELAGREGDARCRLGCCYGRYRHGDEAALEEMIACLDAGQETLQCSALSLLRDVLDEKNADEILAAAKRMEKRSQSVRVQPELEDCIRAAKSVLRRKRANVWTMTRWKNVLPRENAERRSGLRLRFERNIDPELRRGCLEFAGWLREQYEFPMRIPVYVKAAKRLRAMDGELVYGTCFCPERMDVEPFIRIAAGNYPEQCVQDGAEAALAAVLHTLAHELTHYFQWLNQLKLTPQGAERQANRYAEEIVGRYMEAVEKHDEDTV